LIVIKKKNYKNIFRWHKTVIRSTTQRNALLRESSLNTASRQQLLYSL
jgi:hypothetical protein